ncbi:MAG: holo-ACP synthase [Acidobacteriota bacterium]|nr:holo-ACP synthase [Acidobacteriota bacterium]
MSGQLIGLGLDVVDIPRFREVLRRRPALAERLFSPDELAYAATLANPAPTLAGRFATKEAVMKALGVGLGAVDWKDISVQRRAGGAPELAVQGRAAELARKFGVGSWKMSISHTDTVATATVVALT